MATASGSPGSRGAPRAPRGLRRGARSGLRPDRDGDLTMDVAVKGSGRIGKATPSPAPGRDLTARPSRGGIRGGSLLSHKSRSAIARHVALNDVSMKGARTTVPRGSLVELAITGWEKSKASSDKDGGVSSLIRWLDKKASHRLGSRTREVKIKKVCRRQRYLLTPFDHGFDIRSALVCSQYQNDDRDSKPYFACGSQAAEVCARFGILT